MTANCRLGISTHSIAELARAHALRPSYIALGPIYPTTTKIMPFAPQGLNTLKEWRQWVDCQLVAIGGINLENLSCVLACGVDGVAVISALTQARSPYFAYQQFLSNFHYV
jgi:thiamine-phosphate diphosphorylase